MYFRPENPIEPLLHAGVVGVTEPAELAERMKPVIRNIRSLWKIKLTINRTKPLIVSRRGNFYTLPE